ncbi:hypothetical protein SAMN05660657_00151 [Geodermatophilus amargosae]|uniref:Alpha/beta hydrolase family protein n=1 Tax=Geodermatophilus amargosae TaxID=1296565 RepID=A0A1I6X5E8_9ACTN|nr:hypothetical protein [Geodermatophilus amargosae]SFT33565.1 hypothetical protein SAMN05660657_00151 [Geodermatophilus amargosae]
MATPVVRETRVVHGQRRSFLVGGEGPPLLLVHGLGTTSSTRDGVLERPAAAGHTVIAPDLLGHPDAVRARVPGARIEVFEGAGHRPHLDDPDRFVTTLLDLLATTEPWRTTASPGGPCSPGPTRLRLAADRGAA